MAGLMMKVGTTGIAAYVVPKQSMRVVEVASIATTEQYSRERVIDSE
tara:strand:+ start:144 stop:284 length:141 start_codon:yes stop_codon:yes gene_type:complete